MSRWDLLVQQRKWLWGVGWALFGVALLVAFASFWHPEVRSTTLLFVLLGVQALSGAGMLQRVADMQAALDMRKLVLKAPLVTTRQRLVAGDTLSLIARDGTKYQLSTDISVDLKVEYMG